MERPCHLSSRSKADTDRRRREENGKQDRGCTDKRTVWQRGEETQTQPRRRSCCPGAGPCATAAHTLCVCAVSRAVMKSRGEALCWREVRVLCQGFWSPCEAQAACWRGGFIWRPQTHTLAGWVFFFFRQNYFLFFYISRPRQKDHQDESMAQMHLHVLCRYQDSLVVLFPKTLLLFFLMYAKAGRREADI